MENPLVSVIIPCFNQGQYLSESLHSVLKSTYENLEIIVVNDGSTLDSKFLSEFCAPKTKVIHQENQGSAVARNNGIKLASGKYILPLDADDKIHCTYIEKAVKILENDEKIAIVYCEAEFFGIKTGKWRINEFSFPEILWSNSIFCSALYKKSDWENVGGYKKEMDKGFEDWEFWISLLEHGALVYRIPETLFYYRQSLNSRSARLQGSKNEIALIKKIISLHPKIYAENLEEILLPLYAVIKYYSMEDSFLSKLKYKFIKILADFLIKMGE